VVADGGIRSDYVRPAVLPVGQRFGFEVDRATKGILRVPLCDSTSGCGHRQSRNRNEQADPWEQWRRRVEERATIAATASRRPNRRRKARVCSTLKYAASTEAARCASWSSGPHAVNSTIAWLLASQFDGIEAIESP